MNYLRTVHAFLILLVGACTACAPGQLAPLQLTNGDHIDAALKSSISLYDRGGDTVCAGVRVGRGAVLTAYHCVVAAALPAAELEAMSMLNVDLNDVAPARVMHHEVHYSTYDDVLNSGKRKDRNRRLGIVAKVAPAEDLAVIMTADIGQPIAKVRSEALVVGEDIFAIGHPAGLEYTYSRGWVATACRRANYLPAGCWTQVDMTIWGGSSGGGLFDSAGQLVGVASMMARPGQGFFVPPQVVTKFLAT